MFAYTQHLQESVQDSLAELSAFMDKVNEGLQQEVLMLAEREERPHEQAERLRVTRHDLFLDVGGERS